MVSFNFEMQRTSTGTRNRRLPKQDVQRAAVAAQRNSDEFSSSSSSSSGSSMPSLPGKGNRCDALSVLQQLTSSGGQMLSKEDRLLLQQQATAAAAAAKVAFPALKQGAGGLGFALDRQNAAPDLLPGGEGWSQLRSATAPAPRSDGNRQYLYQSAPRRRRHGRGVWRSLGDAARTRAASVMSTVAEESSRCEVSSPQAALREWSHAETVRRPCMTPPGFDLARTPTPLACRSPTPRPASQLSMHRTDTELGSPRCGWSAVPKRPHLLEQPGGFFASLCQEDRPETPSFATPWIPSRPTAPSTPYRMRKTWYLSAAGLRKLRQASTSKPSSRKSTITRKSTSEVMTRAVGGKRSSVMTGIQLGRGPELRELLGGEDSDNDNDFAEADDIPVGAKLKPSRTTKFSVSNEQDKYGVNSAEEIDLATEAFTRHFDSIEASHFCRSGVLEAVADFGIMAKTRPERLAIESTLRWHEEGQTFSLNEFFDLIEGLRQKLHRVIHSHVSTSFRTIDRRQRGMLDFNGGLRLLESSGLTDPTDEMIEEARAIFELAGVQVPGNIGLDEAAHFVQLMREWQTAKDREQERVIIEEEDLTTELVQEFAGQLVEMWEALCLLDGDADGVLEAPEVMHMLTDLGYVKDGPEAEAAQSLLAAGELGGDVRLGGLLEIIWKLRAGQLQAMRRDVQLVFDKFDRDGSGTLDFREVSNVLECLGLAPATQYEQHCIAYQLELACQSQDGNDAVTLDVLGRLMQRIQESLYYQRRKLENKTALALEFEMDHVYDLRNVFGKLDSDGSGELEEQEVCTAIHELNWPIRQQKVRELFQEVDRNDGSGALDFLEFLQFSRKCWDFLHAAHAHDQDKASDEQRPSRVQAPKRRQALTRAAGSTAAVGQAVARHQSSG
eukprot:TRINITY_DN16975_c0_g1_i3.p1 TRINITY_DN16975_c0_g1~~TRINITY_DN16975_c0_g1_i3.p1  ORF type:complete len:896 (+),score=255.44 TRINITY_DN16975_c0_g1_i3:219-2906(+)